MQMPSKNSDSTQLNHDTRRASAQLGTACPAHACYGPFMSSVVCVTSVVKRVLDGRERRTVLDGVSFSLQRGDMGVVRGPSGSGKTTLLAIVGAMLTPTSGEVQLDGEPTSRLREAHRADVRRRKVGFLFQDLQLIDAMTALENVTLPRVPDGLTSADVARAQELLERLGVGALASSRAKALSGGERQRVALARALMNDPLLLVLDEPTAHLDDERAADVASRIEELGGEGRAVLVSTHDPRLTSRLSTARFFELSGGRLHERGAPDAGEGDPSEPDAGAAAPVSEAP
jgi:putative ABC transport system ATP-binding protein